MIALASVAKQLDARDSVRRSRSEPLPVPRGSPQREDLAAILPAFSPTEECSTITRSSASRSRDLPGTKIVLARSGIPVHSKRQRHGGFSVQAVHPVLASRYNWRTAASSCLATHDESLLLHLSSASCSDTLSTASPPAPLARSDITAARRRSPVAFLARPPSMPSTTRSRLLLVETLRWPGVSTLLTVVRK